MSVQFKNPWGQAADNQVQRSDLFVLDLASVINGLKDSNNSQVTSSHPLYYNLPSPDFSWIFATQVTMPTAKKDKVEISYNSVSRTHPTYILPPDGMKVEFRVENSGDSTASQIEALIVCWRYLIRAGRPTPYGGPNAPLPRATFVPKYKFDLPVYSIDGQATYNSKDEYPKSHIWTINEAWPINHSVSSFSQEQGAVKISVDFVCTSISYSPGSARPDPTVIAVKNLTPDF